MIEIVAASPKSEHQFYAAAPLGISLRRLAADKRIAGRICFGNTGAKKDGLPAIFNRQIAAAGREAIIVFTHDDVWLDDCFLADRLVEALKHFDVVGVAGNRRILPHQPAWAFVDEKFTWDEPKHLSGGGGPRGERRWSDFPFRADAGALRIARRSISRREGLRPRQAHVAL